MTRIVGGELGGRRLDVPGTGTRPTSERAREALFSTLEALCGGLWGLRFADLYAGSGAVGLEAASRGAAHVLLVERSARAAGVIRRNAAALELTVDVRQERVERLLAQPPDAAYDVVYLDPPYADAVDEVLARLVAHGWLIDGAVVVVERAARDPELRWPPGVEPLKARRYGDALLWYGRRS